MERQFTKEIESLRLGDGETFHGEGILAVTKALLQSGVSYVGGYQGAPVSHLLDVMVQARLPRRARRARRGVHRARRPRPRCSALDQLPARGATWKSIVGTNVAADALVPGKRGVMGGTLIVLGEDYGEGGVVAQERSRVRHEIADVAARPAAQPRHHRRWWSAASSSRSIEYPGDDGAADPRLPCGVLFQGKAKSRARGLDRNKLDGPPRSSSTTAWRIRRRPSARRS